MNRDEAQEYLARSGVDPDLAKAWRDAQQPWTIIQPYYLEAIVKRANCTLKSIGHRRLFARNDFKYIIPATDWTEAIDLRLNDTPPVLKDKTELE